MRQHRVLLSLAAIAIAALVGSALVGSASSELTCGNWTQLVQARYQCLDMSDDYLVYYRGDTAANRVWIGLEVQGNNNTVPGWVGFGISTQGGMKGAAITVIRSNASANGETTWQVESRYSTAYAMPMLVDVPGVVLQSVVTLPAQGIVRALFYRPLDACVNGSIRIEPGQPHAVIWAFGMGDFDLGHENENRGNSFVNFMPSNPTTPTTSPLIQPASETTTFQTNATTYNSAPAVGFSNKTINTTTEQIVSFMTPPHEIPTSMDYYMCFDFSMPDNSSRQIISTAGLENGPPPGFVHHMILFACTQAQPPRNNTNSAGGYQCTTMPSTDCVTIVAVWAPGTGANGFPKDTGIATGPNGYQYFTLQIHYHNMGRVPGVFDQSGMQLLVTSQPRKYEVGTLILGTIAFSLRPNLPYQQLNQSWCPSGCTKRFPTNITVFSVNLHAHMAGQSISVRHIRGGQELRPIAETNYYDYRFQPNYQVAPDTATIMPGDELITQCAYNTLGRNVTITYGEGTNNEMCFAFLHYWPKMDNISMCVQGGNQLLNLPYATCGSLATFTRLLIGARRDPSVLMTGLTDGTLTPVTQSTFSTYVRYGPVCEARVNATLGGFAMQDVQGPTRTRLRRLAKRSAQ